MLFKGEPCFPKTTVLPSLTPPWSLCSQSALTWTADKMVEQTRNPRRSGKCFRVVEQPHFPRILLPPSQYQPPLPPYPYPAHLAINSGAHLPALFPLSPIEFQPPLPPYPHPINVGVDIEALPSTILLSTSESHPPLPPYPYAVHLAINLGATLPTSIPHALIESRPPLPHYPAHLANSSGTSSPIFIPPLPMNSQPPLPPYPHPIFVGTETKGPIPASILPSIFESQPPLPPYPIPLRLAERSRTPLLQLDPWTSSVASKEVAQESSCSPPGHATTQPTVLSLESCSKVLQCSGCPDQASNIPRGEVGVASCFSFHISIDVRNRYFMRSPAGSQNN